MSRNSLIEFELTAEHLLLLSRLRWDNSDWGSGAPAVDSKRPFGNSAYQSDVCELLEWPEDVEEGWTEDQYDRAAEIFSELPRALEVVLQLKTFDPGRYVKKDGYGERWRKA